MKVDNNFVFFYFVLSCWNFRNQIASCNVIDIFENLTMSRGTLTWVEFFGNYNAKVLLNHFLVNINKIIIFKNLNPKVYLVFLKNSCKVKFNEVYFIIFILKVWKILKFEWVLLLKIQNNYNKLGLEGYMSRVFGLKCLELWCGLYWLLNHFFIELKKKKPRLKTILECGGIQDWYYWKAFAKFDLMTLIL